MLFAKPRSRPTEVRDGVELPAYRGDAVNGFDFTAQSRTPDPGRLVRAYHCAAVIMNLCRAFAASGDACVINTINGDSNVPFFKEIAAAGLAAGMLAIGYTITFVVPYLGGAVWDATHLTDAALLPGVVGALIVVAMASTLRLEREG